MNETVWAAVALLLGIALWTDVRRMEIPNGLTVTFAAAGLAYHGVAGGIEGLGHAGLGAAAGLLPLLIMYGLRGIGGGDVKWFAAFGAWAGANAAWQLVVLSILYAGGIAVLLLVLKLPGLRRIGAGIGRLWSQPSSGRFRGTMAFPFMLAVAPALVTLGVNS
ncbi:A24 family peptidase [Cohnella lubricantis]|uniref:Prepilin peptidase n=1 Tax=Cohnella lubricantis TaxID=2163172 RepID=A0A841TF63_9BACL|nr:A24 family peptidase [Cohnella lubricantis]MBB6677111.1 prepilin peptidase [Cohnella lubricantis]MBP2118958.1 prepilin peptidase CpaA [Cohnella lubricantis]